MLSRSWLRRGAAWWFVIPAAASVIAVIGAIKLTRQPVFPAWPFLAAAMIFGLFAWWMFEDSRAERSLLNAVVAAMFLAIAIYGVVMPSLTPLFPSAEVARALRNVVCVGPKAAAAGFHEPSLVFMTGTSHAADRRIGRCGFPRAGQLPLRAGGIALGARLRRSAPKRSGCATTWPTGSRAIISRRARRSRSPSSARKARSKMPANSERRRIPELRLALRDAGVVVAGATGALAVAFAARRGRAAGGAPRAVAVGRSRCRDHRADVRARRVRKSP